MISECALANSYFTPIPIPILIMILGKAYAKSILNRANTANVLATNLLYEQFNITPLNQVL